MKCPRCGSGQTQSVGGKEGFLPGKWLRRYFCRECQHTWVDQVDEAPPRRGSKEVDG